MTKEPLYIISGEELDEYVGLNDIFRPNAMRLADKIRSRPYNPDDQLVWMTPEEEEKRIRQDERKRIEQEKQAAVNAVLDQAMQKIQGRIDGIFEAYHGELNEKVTVRPYAMADGMGEAILMIKKIRQQTGQTSAEQQRGREE